MIATEKVCSEDNAFTLCIAQNGGMQRKAPPNHIRYWRNLAGLTQQRLAEKLAGDANKGSISQYESGERFASLERIYEIAAILGTLAGALLDGPFKGAPAETEAPQQPTLPNAADFAQILDALAPLASASRKNEAELQELRGHFRAMIELRLQHPDYSMERILGSLDERLRARVDQVAPPA